MTGAGRAGAATGSALVLVSAAAFGTLAIIAKLGYQAGMGAVPLLTSRFLLAGTGMLALAFATGHSPLRLPGRRLAALIAMGAVGYFGQSGSFFLALRTLPASEVELVLYTYPALVVLAGVLILRRPVRRVQAAALVGTLAGAALLVGGARFESGPALVLAALAPFLYTAYILVGDRVMAGLDAVAAGTVAICGSALSWTLVALVTHQLALPSGAVQWEVAAGLAVLPTMVAITTFLAGLPRIGAAQAALLSTFEPVVTVVLAFILLGDRFTVWQALGAVLVLASVVLLTAPGRAGPRPPPDGAVRP